MKPKSLLPYIRLSIAAAVMTILLKTVAYYLTGSVGLLSDAAESFINLVAAISALFLLKLAEKPPDEDHAYGHTKAEYFSSIIEATLIVIAAIGISITAIDRWLHPIPLEFAPAGLITSFLASAINLFVAMTLLRVGRKNNSVTLQADGHHLLTDVWTSVGVLAGVGIVFITNLPVLDSLIALAVAGNILHIGYKLLRDSALGLMDTSLPNDDQQKIKHILDEYKPLGVAYHGIKTRQSATRKFMSVHILVPGKWTVQKGHDLLESIEENICRHIPKITVFTHLEPIEDPKSQDDISIDRD